MLSLPTLPRTSLKFWSLPSTTLLTPSTTRTLCSTLPLVSVAVFLHTSVLTQQMSTLSKSPEGEMLVSVRSNILTRTILTLTLRHRPLPRPPHHPQLSLPLPPPQLVPTSLPLPPSLPDAFSTLTTTTARVPLPPLLLPLPPNRPVIATLTQMEVSHDLGPVVQLLTL